VQNNKEYNLQFSATQTYKYDKITRPLFYQVTQKLLTQFLRWLFLRTNGKRRRFT